MLQRPGAKLQTSERLH
uniref:Uncharacterized protein n=1 Tax=Anguilla anguilla TaxID=7936 RepID=A0A0E9SVU5_ANGAN